MNVQEYTRMAERETNYWWHIGRLKIIETNIQKYVKGKKDLKILNVGCGTGGTIDMLERLGIVDNVDASEEAINYMRKRGYKRLTKVEGILLPIEDKTYDMVVAFDVLEHIEDDVAALKEWRRVLKDDGMVFLTVPAYQWLWTGHDESLHHFRRYTTKMIKDKAHAAGLGKRRLSYAIVFSLPLVVGFRMINKLRGKSVDSETSYVNVPNFLNNLFIQILKIEAWFHKFIRFGAGTTVLASLSKSLVNEEEN